MWPGSYNRIKTYMFNVHSTDNYFNSRLPIVMKRIAQGGVRLAMILNRVFGEVDEDLAVAT